MCCSVALSPLNLAPHADDAGVPSPVPASSPSPPSLLSSGALALLPDSLPAVSAASLPSRSQSPPATMLGVGVDVEAGALSADFPAPFALPPAAVTTGTGTGGGARRARALKGAAARDHHHAGRSIAATAAAPSSSSSSSVAAVAPPSSLSDWARHALLPALLDFLSTPSRALPVALGLLSLSYLLLFSLRTHVILLLLSSGIALLAASLLLSVRASGGLLSLLSPASRHMLLDYNLLELVKISWHSRTLQDVLALVIFPLSKDERRRIIQRLPARLAALLTKRGVVHLLPKPAKRIMGHAHHRPTAAERAAAEAPNASASASGGGAVPQALLSSVSQPNLFARDSDAEADGEQLLAPPAGLSHMRERAPSRSPGGSPELGPCASPGLGSTRARRSMSTGCLFQAEEQADAEAALSQLDDELRTQAQLQSQPSCQRAAEREKRRSARREERQRERAARVERKEEEEDDGSSDHSSVDSDDLADEHVEWRVRRSLRRPQAHHQHDHTSAFSTSSSSSASASASSPSSSSSSSSSDRSGSSTPDVRNYDECTPSPAHVYFGSPADTAAMTTASAVAAYQSRPRPLRIQPSFTFPRATTAAAGSAVVSSASPSASGAVSSSSYRAPLSTFLPLPSSVDDLSFANLLDRQLRLQARDSLRNLWRALWAAANDEAKQQWAAMRPSIPPSLLPYCTPAHLRVLLPMGGALAATQLLAVSPRCRGLLLSGVRLGADAAVLGTACAAAVTVYTELHATTTVDTRNNVAPSSSPSPSPSRSPSVGPLRSPSLASSASAAVAPSVPVSSSSTLLPSFALYCRLRAQSSSAAAAASSPLMARLHTARLFLAWLFLRYRASGPLRTATLVLVMWMAWMARRSAAMRGAQRALAGVVARMTRWP